MPELMIKPAPTPSANGNGNAKAVGPGETGNRSEGSAKTDLPNATSTPFAAVLKSRMEKKEASADKTSSAQPATAAEIAANTPVTVDLAAFLPLLSANPVAAAAANAPATAEQAATAVDSALQAELQAAAARGDAQSLAAPVAAPAPLVAAVSPEPTFITDTSPRKQNVENREPLPAAASARSDAAALASGKIELDAAINADARRGNTESADAAADFHALLDRTTAITAGANAAAATATAATSSSPSLRVDTPLGQAGWHEEVGQKLTWMVNNNNQKAELVLNPPQLGRIEVSLTLNGDQASATFTSANPVVREALENSLQRLREVLADAGVTLGQTQVGSQSQQQAWRQEAADFGAGESVRYASTIPVPGSAAGAPTGTGRGMIDVFA